MSDSYHKYLKYKTKYNNLKTQINIEGGAPFSIFFGTNKPTESTLNDIENIINDHICESTNSKLSLQSLIENQSRDKDFIIEKFGEFLYNISKLFNKKYELIYNLKDVYSTFKNILFKYLQSPEKISSTRRPIPRPILSNLFKIVCDDYTLELGLIDENKEPRVKAIERKDKYIIGKITSKIDSLSKDSKLKANTSKEIDQNSLSVFSDRLKSAQGVYEKERKKFCEKYPDDISPACRTDYILNKSAQGAVALGSATSSTLSSVASNASSGATSAYNYIISSKSKPNTPPK